MSVEKAHIIYDRKSHLAVIVEVIIVDPKTVLPPIIVVQESGPGER
jgi:hypothetical protein